MQLIQKQTKKWKIWLGVYPACVYFENVYIHVNFEYSTRYVLRAEMLRRHIICRQKFNNESYCDHRTLGYL